MPEGQGIDCLEEAEFCRMRTGKCGIDGRTSGTDGMLSATRHIHPAPLARPFSKGLLSFGCPLIPRETLIQSLSDFTLEFLYMARNNLTRIASYLRKAMTKSCVKILVKSDSAI